MTGKARLMRFILPVGVSGIVITLALLLLYNDPVRRVILEPATWAINDVRQSLAALPQALLWAVVLLIGCAILILTWRRVLTEARSRPDHRRWTVVKPRNANAIASLARDLASSPKRHVSRVRIVRELSILAVRLIAQREGISLEEAQKLLLSNQWPDDSRVRQFFATRRAGQSNVPRQSFVEAVEYTLAYLDRYHQEV